MQGGRQEGRRKGGREYQPAQSMTSWALSLSSVYSVSLAPRLSVQASLCRKIQHFISFIPPSTSFLMSICSPNSYFGPGFGKITIITATTHPGIYCHLLLSPRFETELTAVCFTCPRSLPHPPALSLFLSLSQQSSCQRTKKTDNVRLTHYWKDFLIS